jgi:hypothetical protein
MRKGLLLMAVVGVLLMAAGCGKEGPMGPAGPTGATGPTGPAGTATLLAQYTNTAALASDGDYIVTVPEIQSKINTTYVEVYFQSAADVAANIWRPVSDGNNALPYATINWTAGQVKLYNMKAGDFYLIKVFLHN